MKCEAIKNCFKKISLFFYLIETETKSVFINNLKKNLAKKMD